MSPREAIGDELTGTRIARGDVLAWAALDLSEVPELDPLPFDVHSLIGEVADRFGADARDKGVALEVKTATSVPTTALGEAEWLRTVLCGVMDNAVRFTDGGEVVASITADPTGGGSRVLFHAEVSDTGCGMSAEAIARVFGPRNGSRFTPLGGVAGDGTLSVVHRLVELMDGRLGCSSALGMGTTTWFTVPLDLPQAA